jgi:hypothetical protein
MTLNNLKAELAQCLEWYNSATECFPSTLAHVLAPLHYYDKNFAPLDSDILTIDQLELMAEKLEGDLPSFYLVDTDLWCCSKHWTEDSVISFGDSPYKAFSAFMYDLAEMFDFVEF